MRSGIASALANLWFLTETPDHPLDPGFQEATAFFGPKHPWRIIAAGAPADEVGRTALAHRLTTVTAEPGMLLDPIRAGPASPAGLTVRNVRTSAELEDFATAWCSAFQIPHWIFEMVLPHGLPDDPGTGARNRLLVGYAGSHPVACSSVIVSESVAGIFSVGTTRAARGHGYGTALTWRAVEEGQRLGANVAYLGATAMGYPVYERMGFRKVAEYPAWVTPVGFLQQIGLLLGMWRLARAARARTRAA